jgi:ribosomal protein S11
MHGIFNSMAGAGWTLVAAAGDDGSTDICDSSKDTATVSVDYPGSDPNFVSVGGTRLDLDSNGNFVSEITWNSGGSPGCWGAGGGGVSSYFSQPSWQNGLTYLESIAGQEYVVSGNTMRFVPDISLNAGAGQYYYDGGWDSVYGTSIGAPELAGFFAQENSYLNFIGHICGSDGTSRCEPIGNPNWILYGEGKNPSAPHYPFYDITSECNYSGTGLGLGLTEYCADSGYDLATGWGTANMLQLAWTINWDTIPADGSPSVNFSSSNPATGVWYNSNQNVDWTVSDSGSGGLPAPGVAGFTQGWDSVPTDPYSEPNGGSGNSFYSGPEFPNATSGCLGLNNTNCGYSPGQGCHTVHVMAWDNQGNSTGDQTYGPLCYDTVAPTVSINTSVAVSGTGWFNISTGVPNVSFSATDPGGSNASGVQTIYGVLGPTTCSPSNMSTCQTYGGPFPIPQGASPVMAFSKDNAGNYSSVDSVTYYVDTVAPVTTISVVGEWNNNTSTSAVTVNLTATDATSGVQTTYYTLNGGPANVYSSPFVISAAGSHTLKYWSVDYAGNTEAKHTKTFAIQSPTTATLVASPNPSVLGQSVTMTATIKATLTGTPTGSVVFWNGATNLGTAKLSGGIATLSTTALPLGALTLQASFLGSTYYAATNSAPFDQTVNESTTTTVSSSPNPAAFGQSVTLTATVAPSNSGTPTGTVGFYVSGNFVGSAPMSGSVATVATTFVPGSYAITAVYSGDATYLSSTSSNTLTETVAKASQTITFPAITGTQYALSNLALTATASSGLPISYSSTTTTVCTVSGGTLSLLTSGTCVVHAAQAGNSDYSAAATVAQSFAVHAVSQTITFPAITQTPFALTQITLVATATSGLPVTITSITPTVCTVSGFTASLLVPGTCVLHAAQAGNSDYSPAPTLAQDFTVVKAQQSITFPAITGTQYALSKVTLTATASSSLAVAYTSTTPTVCTVSGSTASLLASGTCVLHANQAGNTLYAAASMVAQSFSVHLIAQTITFPAITGTQYAGSQLTLTATASSGLAVSYTSTTTTVCTVSGNTASLLTAGTCVLHASQAGNSDYAAAPTLAQSFAVKAAVN